MKTVTHEAPDTHSLEQRVAGCHHSIRDQAIGELQAAIQLVLFPRSTTTFGSTPHFLSVPEAPRVERDRGGLPRRADEKALSQFQEELAAVTHRERTLVAAAQRAQGVLGELNKWLIHLGDTESRLLISSLSPEDEPDVQAYEREHARFIRCCQSWAAKLILQEDTK